MILFFIFYVQMSTSLTLFALRNVDPRFMLFDTTLFTWSAAQFQALNPIWIMLLAVLVWVYNAVAKSGRDLPVAAKYALGFGSVAAGYLVFTISGRYAVDGRVVVVHGVGLRPLLARRTAGERPRPRDDRPLRAGAHERLHDGAYFVATGVSQYLGSVVANFAQMPSHELPATESLPLYLSLFEKLGWLAAIGMVLALLLLPLMNRLSRQHQRCAEERREEAPQAQGVATAQ